MGKTLQLLTINNLTCTPGGCQVLYHHISSVERQPLTTKGYPLVISCKTFQQLYLIIPRESDCLDTIETIHMFAQPRKCVCACMTPRVLLSLSLPTLPQRVTVSCMPFSTSPTVTH